MAWNDEMLIMLRYHIHDIDSATYTDTDLNKFLLLGASYVKRDLSRFGLDATYVISVASGTMTPDPSEDFTVLSVLKAGCILSTAEQKKHASQYGFKIVDDKSVVDGKSVVEGSLAASKNYCNLYDEALEEYRVGKMSSSTFVHGILSPYADGSNALRYTRWGNSR